MDLRKAELAHRIRHFRPYLGIVICLDDFHSSFGNGLLLSDNCDYRLIRPSIDCRIDNTPVQIDLGYAQGNLPESM